MSLEFPLPPTAHQEISSERDPWLYILVMKCLLGFAAILSIFGHAQEAPLRITVRPQPLYIERTRMAQLVNCDFMVENSSTEKWILREIEVSAYDAGGKLEVRKFVNDNGNSPSIATLNKREARPGERMLVFNPLFSFDREIQLATLVYRFSWRAENGQREMSSEVTVKPEVYKRRESLRLPIRGRVIIWDGHDYYAHHRRFDYVSPGSGETGGTNSNPERYSYDFVPVNLTGDMRNGDPGENASWFGFGQPIYAAAAGRVVAAFDDALDNREVDEARFEANRLADYGNYIIVNHGDGEFALYGHIKHGSAKVKAGDLVRPGRQIAAIGASGSSLMPHLHFQLQTTADANGEGLPSYFNHFFRILGTRMLTVPSGQIDSGDLIQDLTSLRSKINAK
jgi:Peptidase family M23